MKKRQLRRVQKQPRRERLDLRRRVERVAENGMTEMSQMNPQLMRAPSQRNERNARSIRPSLDDAPIRRRRAPLLEIDFMPRRMIKVFHQRRSHSPLLCRHLPRHQCQILLRHFAPLELPAELPMRFAIAGEDNQAAGIAVEAMDMPRFGPDRFRPSLQAIELVASPAGNR